MPQEISINVNGQNYTLRVEPETPLIFVLRNDLGLKSVKLGCGLEQCGSCTILLDGERAPSCRLPVRSVQGREITTLEGLAAPDDLHPLQEAFIAEGAVQCGFCTPGMILAAKALLDRNPCPGEAEIRAVLAQNLCRCGTYGRVVRAVKRASGQLPDDSRLRVIDQAPVDGVPFLSPSLRTNPDLDSWVRVNGDGTITLFTGKVELGQGVWTAVAQIGAEELDVTLDRIRVAAVDTAHSPDEGMTVGSMSLETSGNAIRQAAAEARHIMLSVAYEELEVPLERLAVTDGTIHDPVTGRSTTYWDLFGGRPFGCEITGLVRPKAAASYAVVGQPAPRLDVTAKVTGRARFVHDLERPGMVHGRVVRPPRYGARLVACDEAAVSRMPGVLKVVRDGSFLAVLAEREEQAVAAMEALRASAQWEGGEDLPAQADLVDHMLAQDAESLLVVDGTPVDDPVPPLEAPPDAARTVAARYFRPYQGHGSTGPSAAVARMEDGRLTVWAHAQGVYPQRAAIAGAMRMREGDVEVIHVEGPGCYGHNGADDAALDAALLARALPGRPVSLKWTRAGEHLWEPYGPATVIDMQASLDAKGRVIDWNHDVRGYPHLGRPRGGGDTSALLAAGYLAEPFPRPKPQSSRGPHVGVHRNAQPLYVFPRQRIVKHFLPGSPLRTSALRGLGAFANIFAIESFMDELAHAAGADPVEFRLRHLEDERARAVVEAAADRAAWEPRDRPRAGGYGRGVAFAQYRNRQCYAALAVEVRVDRTSGHIQLVRAVIAADAGQVVNPDGLSNQLEGGLVQGVSWTLKEQVSFDRQGVTSQDWYSYPVARFRDAPPIEVVLLNRPGEPYLGSGEAAPMPAGAAIANAVFDATGARLRMLPFTPARVRAALSRRS